MNSGAVFTSQPPVTPVQVTQHLLLASANTRHAQSAHIYVHAKHLLKEKLNLFVILF